MSQDSGPTPVGREEWGGNGPTDTSRAVVECMKLLRRKGFRQSLVHDQLVRVDAVMFCRVWRGIRETVLAYSEREAMAYRVRDADIDPADPFTVDPDCSMWHCGGDFTDVSTRLLDLPPPTG